MLDEALRLVRLEPVGADDAKRPVVRARQHERDLCLERLAQLGGDELAELLFGLGPVDDRDDLRSPRRLHEPPQKLAFGVSGPS